jgi:ornithine carbamoyltransferase
MEAIKSLFLLTMDSRTRPTGRTDLRHRNLLSITDFTREETAEVLLTARRLKKSPLSSALKGRTVGLIFQKPSTRTAVSFAVGVSHLGGQPLILNADVLQLKRGESPKDTGRVLSRYLDAIVIRANHHSDVEEMANVADIPVINGLTDHEHPCQVYADLLTIMEHRKMAHPKALAGFRLTYVGDGNNMANSLMLAAALLGIHIRVACPAGYEPKQVFVDRSRALAAKGKGSVEILRDPAAAAEGADALYTDVWTSMGQEAETQKRLAVFGPYQVNAQLLSRAKKGALVLHCLPAHRGEEITEDVLEGPNSVIFDQAENRLHVQKAILKALIKGF